MDRREFLQSTAALGGSMALPLPLASIAGSVVTAAVEELPVSPPDESGLVWFRVHGDCTITPLQNCYTLSTRRFFHCVTDHLATVRQAIAQIEASPPLAAHFDALFDEHAASELVGHPKKGSSASRREKLRRLVERIRERFNEAGAGRWRIWAGTWSREDMPLIRSYITAWLDAPPECWQERNPNSLYWNKTVRHDCTPTYTHPQAFHYLYDLDGRDLAALGIRLIGGDGPWSESTIAAMDFDAEVMRHYVGPRMTYVDDIEGLPKRQLYYRDASVGGPKWCRQVLLPQNFDPVARVNAIARARGMNIRFRWDGRGFDGNYDANKAREEEALWRKRQLMWPAYLRQARKEDFWSRA